MEAIDVLAVCAPTGPTLTVSESSPYELVSGSEIFYNPSAGNSGSFDVTAPSSDPSCSRALTR